MAIGFPVVAFTAAGRYGAFKLLRAAGGGKPGPRPWQQTTGARSLWIAEHVSWRRVAAGGTVALGSFGVLVAGFMISRATGIGPAGSLLAKGTLQANERILVTDFRMVGIDSNLAGAVTVAARTALSQSRAVSIMGTEDVEQALQRMRRPRGTPIDLALGRELATREGVRALLAGHVIPAGSRFEVSLRLVSADSGRDVAEVHRAAAGLEDIIPTVDALSRDLRGKIGESLRRVRQTPPLPRATTHSLRALQLYADHLAARDPGTALNLLREAIKADSDFASAHRRLWAIGGGGRAERDSALVKAVRLANRLPERERLQVEAAHYFAAYLFPDADRAKAIAIYRQLADLGDQVGMINLPESLINRREYALAESLFVVNVARFPNITNSKEGLIHAQIEQGKLDEAERNIEAALRQHPGFWPIERWKIRMLYFRGQLDEFERVLDSVRVLPDPTRRREATNYRTRLAEIRGRLVERDRLRAALQALQVAAQNPPQNPVARATANLWTAMDTGGDTAAAVRALEEALRDKRQYTGMEAWGLSGVLGAARRPDLARVVLARFTDSSDVAESRLGTGMFVHKALGEIAIAEGRGRDAIEEIRQGDLLPDGPWHPCHLCYYRDMARAFNTANEADSAIVYMEKFVNSPSHFSLETHPGDLPYFLQRLGELHEAKGNRERAIASYERFVELWKNADPVFQPRVAAVRERLSRLRT
jgi:tetratricopeptide (TPR) repeat protein